MTDKLEDIEGNVIDSRDLILAMDEWQSIIDDDEETVEDRKEAQQNFDDLEEFCEPFTGCADWDHGETLISESYWEEYVEEMVRDCGYINGDIPSWIVIDWDQTAMNIAIDYMNDNGYYIRNT